MSNNLDYKQKYLEYKIKYINKKTDIQTGGMQVADVTATDVLLYPRSKQQFERVIDSLSIAEFYNRHLKGLDIPPSIFEKAKQIFIAGVFLNKLTGISTLQIPQLSNNNEGIAMAFYLATVEDQTSFGEHIRQQLNPDFRYPVREKVVTDPADRKDLFLARETELRKQPMHPSVDHVAGQEEPSIDPAAVQDTSGYKELSREQRREYTRLGRQQVQGLHTMELDHPHAFGYTSTSPRYQTHASPRRFEAHAIDSSRSFEARTVDPLDLLRSAMHDMQEPTLSHQTQHTEPSFRIPQDIRKQLEIITTPDDEQNFIRVYKKIYQKNLGNREEIIRDLIQYVQDRYGKRLHKKVLEYFMSWFQKNVRPFEPTVGLTREIKLDQMTQILHQVGENIELQEFEYTNPITDQKITLNPGIFMATFETHGFDEGEKLELYEILFETPESEPDIAEELHTREQVSQELGFEVFDYDDEDGEV